MTVARSSGCAARAAASRSIGVVASRSSRRRRRRARRRASTTPSVSQRGQLGAHLEEALEEPGVLDDRRPPASQWPTRYCDLLGRRRVVDRDRRGAAEERGQVEHVELGPVAQHQHDAVAGADAERPEARRWRGPRGRPAPVGPGDPAVAVAPGRRAACRRARDVGEGTRRATVWPSTTRAMSALVTVGGGASRSVTVAPSGYGELRPSIPADRSAACDDRSPGRRGRVLWWAVAG